MNGGRPTEGEAGVVRTFGAAVCAALLVACGGVTTIQARVVEPPELPLHAFRAVWLVLSTDADARDLSLRLRARLIADRQTDVRIVEEAEVMRAREARSIPDGTVVVRVRTNRVESTTVVSRNQSYPICGPGGCWLTSRPVFQDIPALAVTLTLLIEDGATGADLQRFDDVVRLAGDTYELLSARAYASLTERLELALEPRVRDESVSLLPAPGSDVAAGIAAAERGDWPGARHLFERVARSDEFRTRPASERAAILYDLGIARRFGGEQGDVDAWARRADRALRAAERLDPTGPAAQARERLHSHAQALSAMRAQSRAAPTEPRPTGPREEPIPEPPASYAPPPPPFGPDAGPDSTPTNAGDASSAPIAAAGVADAGVADAAGP